MKIEWMGHACFAVTADNGLRIVTDPFDETVGYPLPWGKADVATVSHGHFDHNCYERLNPANVVKEAGSYEFSGVKITGIPCFHDDAQGAKRGSNIIYVIEADGKRIAHLGDLGHMLNEEQIASLGKLDALLIPVGGTYTLTGEQAAKLTRQINPEAVVPMHYSNDFCKFDITNENAFLMAMNQPIEGKMSFVPGTEFAPVVLMELLEEE